ncbi:MAG: hypothetical protein Q8S15_06185 [Erysipelotrichaceae bacterium]|nr:hypothetical protein [Erysipelotrichaceae bacterium]
MKKLLLALALLVFIAGCTSTDVVKREAQTSFEEILAVDSVESSVVDGYAHIIITEGYHFDLSLNPQSTTEDVIMAVMAMPFLDAGLDITKLPANMRIKDDMLLITYDRLKGTMTYDAKGQMDSLLTNNRDLLAYHAELDHFGIALGDHKFEWAKNMATNDKDAVFILSADVMRLAGVDVEAVDGWLFTTIDGMDLLLKPIELK